MICGATELVQFAGDQPNERGYEKHMIHLPLPAAAAAQGVALDAQALERFALYAQYLAAENKTKNLTAITDPEEITHKHFVDSLLLLPWAQPAPGASLLDVGSGAGFPGVPLAIARPDLRVTLLESNGKKADFLRALAALLGLELRVVCARAEDAARQPELRGRFALVTARAVAPLPVLCELCLPFAAPGGCFAALKGSAATVQTELAQAERAIRTLGGQSDGLRTPPAPLAYGERCCVMIQKISQTPPKYPRSYGIILKKSL
jgi:16S rRNA (guanine527-N7)-methyltransferase